MAMSKHEAAAFQRDLRRGLADQARAAYRQSIAKLDAELADIRSAVRARVRAERDACGQSVAQLYEAWKRERSACSARVLEVRAVARSEVAIVEDRKRAERAFKAEIARIEAAGRARERSRESSRAVQVKEKISALESEIMAVEPRLWPFWQRVRDKRAFILAVSRASPFERLVEAAEADEADHQAAMVAAVEAEDYARAAAAHEADPVRGRGSRARRPSYDDVPF